MKAKISYEKIGVTTANNPQHAINEVCKHVYVNYSPEIGGLWCAR